jgi:predicted alpha-1,2-mannosidase
MLNFSFCRIVPLLGFLLALNSFAQAQSPADYVNPFIGAYTHPDGVDGLGKTFPGATTPFGMVQVSPNTITGGDNGSGYSYEHKTIEGFAFTQMSGIGWYGDLGNFLVMPTTGPLNVIAGKESDNSSTGYRSEYDKKTEEASAGYYSAFLTKYGIKVESSASPHGGILRFTYPKNDKSRIQVDLARRVGGTSVYQYIEVVDNNTIKGWMKCNAEGGGWGNGGGNPDYTVYFYARFSKDMVNHGFWTADIPDNQQRKLYEVQSNSYQAIIAQSKIIKNLNRIEGKHIGFFAEFPTREDEQATLKVGISFTDMDGAKKNFDTELKNKNFDQIRNDAIDLWNKALSKVQVKGGTEEEKTCFYTALYHTMIDPRIMSDVDGQYPGADHKPHRASGYSKRTIFSGWDVFRSQYPLQTIINKQLINDQINSFISLAQESGKGYLDRWEFFNAYSGCMVGNPAISVIVDAYMKNIRNYDVDKVYDIILKTAGQFGNGNFGYTPVEKGYSISETLEYAYSDWCVAQMAKKLGKQKDYAEYTRRATYYKNIFDSSDKKWFRPKKQNGEWEAWSKEGRLTEWYGCVESNPYQQGWFVPHDVDGMIALMGGKEKVAEDLESFFENTPSHFLWNKYYNHANEVVHHVPFLFNKLGKPWLTQKWTRIICKQAYQNEVEGLVGNEDVGQMSAWYVLAASGIHPLCPGDTKYEITSPVFDRIVMTVGEEGKTFTIIAHNNSPENVYIHSIILNGKNYPHTYINHEDIVSGGTMEIEMREKPNMKFR